MKIQIRVKSKGDGYFARGNGLTASCTGNRMTAVERVAIKAKTGRKKVEGLSAAEFGITIRSVRDGLYNAEWTDEAKVEKPKLKKFCVSVQLTVFGHVTVEAKSASMAEELAMKRSPEDFKLEAHTWTVYQLEKSEQVEDEAA